MSKDIQYHEAISSYAFPFNNNEKFISTLYYDKFLSNWYIAHYDEINENVKTYNIPNIINLTSEQYFQYSLIWDYPFPFDSAYSIINKAHKNNNRFDVFNTETNYYIEEY